MIDHEARRRAAQALERFISCVTTNDEYEDEYPLPELFGRRQSKDRAVKAVYGMSWNWFDDLQTHKLENERALEQEVIDIAMRCILFLKYDFEYEWREDNFMQTGFTQSVLTTLGLIRRVSTIEQRIANHLDQPEGDASVWPFFRTADFVHCTTSSHTGIHPPLSSAANSAGLYSQLETKTKNERSLHDRN